MIERASVARLISEATRAFDAIGRVLTQRELQYRVVLLTTFIRFSAAAHLLKKPAEQQLQMVIYGLKIVSDVLAQQGGLGRYGKNRRCVEMNSAEEVLRVRDMIGAHLDQTKDELARAALTFRSAVAQEKLLIERLLEFCIASRVLGADLTSQKKMMDQVTSETWKLIASGWLDRNVVRVT